MKDLVARVFWFIGVVSLSIAIGACVIGGILSIFFGRDMWVGVTGGVAGVVLYAAYLVYKEIKSRK
jgi:hypothetical protein